MTLKTGLGVPDFKFLLSDRRRDKLDKMKIWVQKLAIDNLRVYKGDLNHLNSLRQLIISQQKRCFKRYMLFCRNDLQVCQEPFIFKKRQSDYFFREGL